MFTIGHTVRPVQCYTYSSPVFSLADLWVQSRLASPTPGGRAPDVIRSSHYDPRLYTLYAQVHDKIEQVYQFAETLRLIDHLAPERWVIQRAHLLYPAFEVLPINPLGRTFDAFAEAHRQLMRSTFHGLSCADLPTA
jgi:hypothetical protein